MTIMDDDDELHVAAARGDFKMLEFLIQTDKEVGCRISLGQRGEQILLHAAAAAGSLDCVKLLVSHGANIHARNYWNWTPLFSAATVPDAVSLLDFLVKSGADVNAVDNRGELPIWVAALHGNLEGVRFLAPKSSLDKQNKDEETILHAAAYGGSLEMVQLLVAAGADITARSISNSSVLHRAAEAGNSDIIEWLLSTHATTFSVNDTTSYGWTPILFATYWNRTSTIKLLLEHGADVGISPVLGSSPLHFAAGYRSDFNTERPFDEAHLENVRSKSDNPAIITLLIQHGADVLSPGTQRVDGILGNDEDGESLQKNIHAYKEDLHRQPKYQFLFPNQPFLPIHHAAVVGNLEKAKVLLAHSNDGTINAQDPWGATPLHLATSGKHLELLRLLVSRGGRMDVREGKGRSVLQYLSYYNGPDTARGFLVECGLYDSAMEEKELNVDELKRVFRSRYLGA